MKKVFGMATIPSRECNLEKVIISIYSNVDYGYIVFNKYNKIPAYMEKYKNIKCFLDKEGALSDGAKLKGLLEIKEEVFYFCCDDDIIYPPSYFNYMVKKAIELKSIVTQHGRRFMTIPIKNFYKNTINRGTHLAEKRTKDIKVPFGGTGVMCFNNKLFNIESFDFIKDRFSLDVWVGIEAFKRKIDIFCVKSDESFKLLKYKSSIWSTLNRNNKYIEIKKNIVFNINKTFF